MGNKGHKCGVGGTLLACNTGGHRHGQQGAQGASYKRTTIAWQRCATKGALVACARLGEGVHGCWCAWG